MEISEYTIVDKNLARAIVRKNSDGSSHVFYINNGTYTYQSTFDEWWTNVVSDSDDKDELYDMWMQRLC